MVRVYLLSASLSIARLERALRMPDVERKDWAVRKCMSHVRCSMLNSAIHRPPTPRTHRIAPAPSLRHTAVRAPTVGHIHIGRSRSGRAAPRPSNWTRRAGAGAGAGAGAAAPAVAQSSRSGRRGAGWRTGTMTTRWCSPATANATTRSLATQTAGGAREGVCEDACARCTALGPLTGGTGGPDIAAVARVRAGVRTGARTAAAAGPPQLLRSRQRISAPAHLSTPTKSTAAQRASQRGGSRPSLSHRRPSPSLLP
ncbi:hypothetical protein B0H19DRAFT_546981 [Mycena capillaripes]|nr:hypothetical protein B0H19DRAFT_546981 [Mycena capillaripes]